MRGPGLLFLAALLMATPAFAQDPSPSPENTRTACTDGRDNDADGHVDCDDQDCQDFTFCAAARADANGVTGLGTASASSNDLAALRGRGTTRVVIGAVLLSLGFIVGGVSSVLWVSGSSGYGFNALYQGATAMDVIGVALLGGGTALLAIGAGNLAEARRPSPPRVAFGPASLAVRF